MNLPHDRHAASHTRGERQKKAKEDRGKGRKEQATMTMKSTLLMSKGALSEVGHRQNLLDMSVHRGGITALLYRLNNYMRLPII